MKITSRRGAPVDVENATAVASTSRRALLGGAAVVGGATLLAGCRSGGGSNASGGVGNFPKTPRYRIVMVNHATTNSFFVPTRYGAEDAAAAFGCELQWTGSDSGDAAEMVSAVQTAIDSKADGIALSMPSADAFVDIVAKATAANIPVIGYSVDAPDSGRLAYVGSSDTTSAKQIGVTAASQLKSGAKIRAFAAEPGSTYVTARLDGLKEGLAEGGIDADIELTKTGFTVAESVSSVQAFLEGNADFTGLFGLDAYATQALGQVVSEKGLGDSVVAAGFDTLEETLKYVDEGALKFTANSQSYLQGFYPVAELFLTLVSGGITGPADVNTGVALVDAASAKTFLKEGTRFQGTSEAQKLVAAS